MHTTLAILRRHVNLLVSPLYRLPPDLFPEIASHLANETDLVNTTHISHRLRDVLLSHPSLWSHLNFGCDSRARAFFERSGRAPLHIDLSWDATRTAALHLDPHLESRRIATLKLRMWSIQQKFLSEPLPSLRRLEISNYLCDGNWMEELGPAKEVTSWSFPSLTSLIVYSLYSIPFHTPHLTCFKFWSGDSPIGGDKLLGFLDNCPSLEHIDIFYRFYEGGHRSKHDLVVSLPNLRSYTETTFGNVCLLSVLNMLSLSPFCSVTLKFCGANETKVEADDILPHFKNLDYLAEIKRVKLWTTIGADGREVGGTLELINARGMRVRSERTDPENKEHRPLGQEGKKHSHYSTHLSLFRNLNVRSVEMVCVDGCAWREGVAIELLKGVLCFGNVGTLILPYHAASWYLSGLNMNMGSAASRWTSPTHTLIIRPDPTYPDFRDFLLSLLNVAQRRKEAGFPFRSVSLFLRGVPRLGSDRVLEELRRCVERLEFIAGDDVLDWDVDKYFLDGLDHLQMNRDVEWD